MENDCLFADIILPSNTKFETDDIGCDNWPVVQPASTQKRSAIEPRGDTMSDYEIVVAIAERLGLKEEYTGGKTVRTG